MASEGIKDILVSAGIGVVGGSNNEWSIRISLGDDKPDTQIIIFDTAGYPPESALAIDYSGIQITVRGDQKGYKAAYQKCKDIKNALLGYPAGVVAGDFWSSITMTSDIISIGYDDLKRPLFTLNFLVIVHPSDLSNSYRRDC